MVRRLNKWWRSNDEQIGSKTGIACTDHILSLHILMNIAKTSKVKLYILFVDFSKAYDRVSRSKLMHMLKESGCGRLMLRAIFLMYKVTKLIYQDTIIGTNTGVKQGSPSSGFLFTFFINPLVKMLKRVDNDGFLEDLHSLLMMDDSVIMATTKERFIEKINILIQFCEDQGMVINELKTQFMVVNKDEADKNDIVIRPDLIIRYTDKYVYLGASITDDGNMCSVMQQHAKTKNAHYLKFAAFVKKNVHAPFYVKRQVFRACVLTALLYSSEAWCVKCVDKSIRKIYMSCVRLILGVRDSTDVDLCLHEVMMPSIEALIYDIQRKYLEKVTSKPEEHVVLSRVMKMGRNVRLVSGHATKCKLMKHIDNVIETNDKQRIMEDMEERRARINATTKTKSMLYKQWNPTLAVHDAYVTRKHFPEHWRIAWSRFRLGSTDLPCEKSRWSKTENETICRCGGILSETHILLQCPDRITNSKSLAELFRSDDQRKVMKCINDTLEK